MEQESPKLGAASEADSRNLLQRAYAFAKENAGSSRDFIYSHAVGGMGGFGGAIEISEHYAKGKGSLEERAQRLVRTQCLKAGASGFATGTGGAWTIPISITTSLYVQVVMLAAIAHMAGTDIHSDEVKAQVYALIIGDALVLTPARKGAINVAEVLAKQAILQIPSAAISLSNKFAGALVVTKFGTHGVVNLGKMIPLVGAVVGLVSDFAITRVIGMNAIAHFIKPKS